MNFLQHLQQRQQFLRDFISFLENTTIESTDLVTAHFATSVRAAELKWACDSLAVVAEKISICLMLKLDEVIISSTTQH